MKVLLILIDMTLHKAGWFAGAAILVGGAAGAAVLAAPHVSFERPADAAATPPAKPLVQHIPTPTPVKALYMTQCVAGTPSFRGELVKFVDSTELNAVVIDIKDFSGGIAFPTDNPLLKLFVSTKCGAADMKDFVHALHQKHPFFFQSADAGLGHFRGKAG